MAEREFLSNMLSTSLDEAFGGEDLLMEVAKDLIKDEMKKKLRSRLDEEPDLKEEFKSAVEMYYEAKVRQTLAAIKMAKASARLGLKVAPEDLRKEFQQELEKEMTKIIDDTL